MNKLILILVFSGLAITSFSQEAVQWVSVDNINTDEFPEIVLNSGGDPGSLTSAANLNPQVTGWVEFEVASGYEDGNWYAGYSLYGGAFDPELISFGFFHEDGIFGVWEGEEGEVEQLNDIQEGDKLRIERLTDGTIEYYQNGNTVYENTTPFINNTLSIGAHVLASNTIRNFMQFPVSTNVPLEVEVAKVRNTYCGSSTGRVVLQVSGGCDGTGCYTPTYQWSTGSSKAKLKQATPGLYSCTITAGPFSKTIQTTIGNKIVWHPVISPPNTNITIKGNSLRASGGKLDDYAPNAAISGNIFQLEGNGNWIEVGLKRLGKTQATVDIKVLGQNTNLYSLLFVNNSAVFVSTNGGAYSQVFDLNNQPVAFLNKDVLRMVEGTNDFIFYQNGIETFTLPAPSTGTFIMLGGSVYPKLTNIDKSSILVGALTNFVCEKEKYVGLVERLNASYHEVNGTQIYFYYKEAYQKGNLSYTIYDEAYEVVNPNKLDLENPDITTNPKRYGTNRFLLKFNRANMPKNKFYILEVQNEKGEKKFLRFKRV